MTTVYKYKKNYNNTPLEEVECMTFVEYLELKGFKYSHIHHETHTTSIYQKAKKKRLGVKRGVPDYLIILPNKLVFIEMKRIKGGRVCDDQKDWIEKLSTIQNVEAYVCKGADCAIELMEKLSKTVH